MVGGGSYAEEDDDLMLEYMGNEGVGSEGDRQVHGVDDSGHGRRKAGQGEGQSQINSVFEACGTSGACTQCGGER